MATKMFPGSMLAEFAGGHEVPSLTNGREAVERYLAWQDALDQRDQQHT